MVERAGRPPRDPRIEEIVENLLTQRTLFSMNAAYAGDDENPRPLPKLSLADWKRYTEFLWQNSRRSGFQAVPSALYFGFYNEQFAGEEGATASLPRDHMWWMVSRGDSVLLSDGIVHHYTVVGDVDRAAGLVSFIDPWPERFFLKEGLNMSGVAAKTVEEMPGLAITGAEFQRVIVGLETLDTPAMLERYLDAFPVQRRNARLLLEFGQALMDAEREDLAPSAAAYFDQSLFAALLAPESERERIAAHLYLALSVALERARGSAEPVSAKPFEDRLYRLLLDHTEPALQQRLSVDQLCRMANAAGWAQNFDRASNLFALAISRQPDHVQARHLRASTSFRRNEYAAAIPDALAALESNAHELAQLQAERDALDPRGFTPIQMAEQKLAGRRTLRSQIYAVLTACCVAAGEWEAASRHAGDWRALRPAEASPLAVLARVRDHEGDHESAARLYREAAELESEPNRKRTLLGMAERAMETEPRA